MARDPGPQPIQTPLNKCAVHGCSKPAAPNSIGCADHPKISPKTACDNLPAVEPGPDRWEAAWRELAEDSSLDPVTVAKCKLLRDREVEVKR